VAAGPTALVIGIGIALDPQLWMQWWESLVRT
jgi:hypothetical protein